MEGYKTQIAIVLGSIFTLLAAFGVGFTEEQQAAIINFMAVAGWPAIMYVMRLVTKSPMKQPGFLRRSGLPAILLLPLLFFGGCASTGDPGKDLAYEFAARSAVYQTADQLIAGNVERAREVQRVSATLLATLDGDPEATVAELEAVAAREIAWERLSPIQRENARELIRVGAAFLDLAIQRRDLPEDYVVAARKLFLWAHQAAGVVLASQ